MIWHKIESAKPPGGGYSDTHAMEVPGGVIIRSMSKTHHGSYCAMVLVPGVRIDHGPPAGPYGGPGGGTILVPIEEAT